MTVHGYSLAELMPLLGLPSIPATRKRVQVLRILLEERALLRRGENNDILVLPEGVELLRRLQDIHSSGVPLKIAADSIADELGGGREQRAADALLGEVRRLDVLVRRLDTRLAHVEATLARPWWARLIGLPRLPGQSSSPEQDQTHQTPF